MSSIAEASVVDTRADNALIQSAAGKAADRHSDAIAAGRTFDGCTVTLGPAAGAARRGVGPAAWAVLERLAESAEILPRGTVSSETVRGLATGLGLAKDTVVRALRRLRTAGLVDHVETRGESGRFGPGHYRLTIDAKVLDLTPALRGPPVPPSRPRSPSSNSTQLVLLDLSP